MQTSSQPDFSAVHQRIRQMLEAYREWLSVTKDGPAGMSLGLPGFEGKPWGCVAGTRLGKSHVSHYLMPIYGSQNWPLPS